MVSALHHKFKGGQIRVQGGKAPLRSTYDL